MSYDYRFISKSYNCDPADKPTKFLLTCEYTLFGNDNLYIYADFGGTTKDIINTATALDDSNKELSITWGVGSYVQFVIYLKLEDDAGGGSYEKPWLGDHDSPSEAVELCEGFIGRPGVEVDLYDAVTKDFICKTVTDMNGWYRKRLPPGSYTIKIPGYMDTADRLKRVTLGAGSQVGTFAQSISSLISEGEEQFCKDLLLSTTWAERLCWETFEDTTKQQDDAGYAYPVRTGDGYCLAHQSFVEWLGIILDKQTMP